MHGRERLHSAATICLTAAAPCLKSEIQAMQLRVNFKSGRPVYLQVMDQVRAAAASGALRPGEALPSIGSLAEELHVSRNGVAKAYSELERLAVIESQPGGVYFLKKHSERLPKEVRRKPLTTEIDPAIMRAPLVLPICLGLLTSDDPPGCALSWPRRSSQSSRGVGRRRCSRRFPPSAEPGSQICASAGLRQVL